MIEFKKLLIVRSVMKKYNELIILAATADATII